MHSAVRRWSSGFFVGLGIIPCGIGGVLGSPLARAEGGPVPGQALRTSSQECIDVYRRTHTLGDLIFNGLPSSTGMKRLDVLVPGILNNDPFTALVAGQKYQVRQYAMTSTYKIPGSSAVQGYQVIGSDGESVYNNTRWTPTFGEAYLHFGMSGCASSSKPDGISLNISHATSGCEISIDIDASECSGIGSQALNTWVNSTVMGTLGTVPRPSEGISVWPNPNADQIAFLTSRGFTQDAGSNDFYITATESELASDSAMDALTNTLISLKSGLFSGDRFALYTDGIMTAEDCSGDTGGHCVNVYTNSFDDSFYYEESVVAESSVHDRGDSDGSAYSYSYSCSATVPAAATQAAWDAASEAEKTRIVNRKVAAEYRAGVELKARAEALKTSLANGTGPFKSVTINTLCGYIATNSN